MELQRYSVNPKTDIKRGSEQIYGTNRKQIEKK